MTRSSQPNFITINPDGSVDANFPGGITMLAATDANPPTSRRIRWVRESNGAVVAEQYTSEDFPVQDSTNIIHHIDPPNGKTQGVLNLGMVTDDPGTSYPYTSLTQFMGDAPFAQVLARAGINVGSQHQVSILEGTGYSSFPQFVTQNGNFPTGPVYIATGPAPFFFNGIATSNVLTLTHNLGFTPSIMLFGMQATSPATRAPIPWRITPTVTTVTTQATTNDGGAIGPGTVNGSYLFVAFG